MADWTSIPDTTFEPGAPAKGRDMRFLRDNPIAIAEGASGAPRIVNAALASGTLGAEKFQTGTVERDWVLARTAAAGSGAVGTYSWLATASTNQGSASPGTTFSGSALLRAEINVISGGSTGEIGLETGGQVAGTWRLMTEFGGGTLRRASLFLRIS